MSVALSFPDGTYSSSNKPSVATLKNDLSLIEDDLNAHEADTTIHFTFDSVASGWVPYSTVVPTRASADDPTYVLTFAGVDLTSTMSVGMKVKWTQNSTVRYGFVTAISFSTNTTLTIYGGTDYDVDDTATYAISAFHYSTQKSPLSFPLDPTKWTAKATDTTNRSQSTPTQNTWYNLGSVSLPIPIGSWRLEYSVAFFIGESTASDYVCQTTLSTANNSESDTELTASSTFPIRGASSSSGAFFRNSKDVILSAKTTYYLNSRTVESGVDSINNRNSSAPAIIRAVCAYL